MIKEEKKALETIKEELQDQKQTFKYYKGVLGVYSNGKVEILLKLIDKQQKEIKDWFEIADNILRATNDYGNITIKDIPKYIERQQKETEREKQYTDFYKDLCDKYQKKIKELKEEQSKRSWVHIKENGEVEPLFYISKDKIREKIKELEEKTKQEKTITFYCNSNDITRTVITNLNELLEVKQ